MGILTWKMTEPGWWHCYGSGGDCVGTTYRVSAHRWEATTTNDDGDYIDLPDCKTLREAKAAVEAKVGG